MNPIYKTNPIHAAEKVAIDQIIEIYFMIDIHMQSIRPENIILFNMIEQIVEPVTFSYRHRILKVTPTNKLKPNSHYQLQLLGGATGFKDITGRIMADTYEVEFYTKELDFIKPPIILSPTDATIVKDYLTIQLQPAINADTYELQISKSNIFQNLIWPTNEEKIYQLPSIIQVTPDIQYEIGSYYLRVRSINAGGDKSSWSPTLRFYYDGAIPISQPLDIVLPPPTMQSEEIIVQDVILQGNSRPSELAGLQQAFTAQAVLNPTHLRVLSSSPKNHSLHNLAENFNLKHQIVITFEEDVDPASVTKDTCYVVKERN